MKHNCQFKDTDGEIYSPFLDAILAEVIEYSDFYEAYMWTGCTRKNNIFVAFPKRCGRVDLLRHCPFCGDELPNENDWKRIQ